MNKDKNISHKQSSEFSKSCLATLFDLSDLGKKKVEVRFTYGQQELALFNTYYGDSCYMPLHIYEGFSGKLITTILKPGRRSKALMCFLF